jgi:hypothetical protein
MGNGGREAPVSRPACVATAAARVTAAVCASKNALTIPVLFHTLTSGRFFLVHHGILPIIGFGHRAGALLERIAEEMTEQWR